MTWFVRLLWLSLPLPLGELVVEALVGRSDAVRWTVVVLAWAVWTGGLLATLITSPLALTALRTAAPLPLGAALVAALDMPPSPMGWTGLGVSAVVAVTAMSADVGRDFLDGASYGDERRFGLRPPAAILLGPLQLTWMVTTVPVLVGAVLLAARQWALGTFLVTAGSVTAWWGLRTLHRLAQRWLVFVPAGVTLVDHLAVLDPVLFRASNIVRIGPAPSDSDATDLSVAATGLILQIDVDPPVAVLPVAGRGAVAESLDTGSVLIAPSRPGAVLDHAGVRSLEVQRGGAS
jgi:hypothetical protein